MPATCPAVAAALTEAEPSSWSVDRGSGDSDWRPKRAPVSSGAAAWASSCWGPCRAEAWGRAGKRSPTCKSDEPQTRQMSSRARRREEKGSGHAAEHDERDREGKDEAPNHDDTDENREAPDDDRVQEERDQDEENHSGPWVEVPGHAWLVWLPHRPVVLDKILIGATAGRLTRPSDRQVSGAQAMSGGDIRGCGHLHVVM
eukprot:scaffold18135_cov116-Isochrysis_galbana.AAC.3